MDTDLSLLFELKQTNTRGHKLKLFKKKCNLNVRKTFSTQLVINDWNKLSSEVINCSTVQQFERVTKTRRQILVHLDLVSGGNYEGVWGQLPPPQFDMTLKF